MMRLWTLLSMLLSLLTGVQSYMIDQDCDGDTQFVQNKIDAAFRLIANAVTELNRTPINPNVANWYNTLFGRPVTQAPRMVLQRLTHLAAISQHNQQDQTVPGGIQDVRFYYTTKRITKRADGNYINKNRNLAYKPKELESRFAHCYNLREPTLMITMTWTGEYSKIQICPWYLRNARGYKVMGLIDLNQPFYTAMSKTVIPIAAKFVYTPIDAFVLMDKAIVHELTHTSHAHPSTVDMKPDPYGFKNAVGLVQNWQNKPDSDNNPQMNADSKALFVTGTWIIVAPGGSTIGADGSFSTPIVPPKAKL
ncbi:hypothetical protein K458DRAFT_386292 [Lentithecium fluviatile CBS 122367]|uniref:Lysine-specific metallo-endopeptidase domain-containing protein n=1 Tax=Lentithecium fluviatile CBS 122367 TaxID=1168545 RepID=A0A6G1JAB8_9PLEO|nr:hypothetical protein K458DRAFT_386292 [Lentithecium fluviatile CBS 122367]